ncbi:MAG: 50S ribosomal protein L22 [Candidatus Yanofskybacteria bacterium]|nr:50S ribosomal protein L22 [Candidatus Yanofskybacteria bacterium]
MTQVTAQLNGLRIAPRKVRLLVDLIKRKPVLVALDQLAHAPKRSSEPLAKLLRSAVASAENTFKLDPETLVIKEMRVDEGIKLKRYAPKGFGRANPIEKKTSRVSVVLEGSAPVAAAARGAKKAKAKKAETAEVAKS